jgi:alkyldihydroxyacetonephosphate synthase
VAYPNHDGDVRDLLTYAGQAGAIVIPYGGGTSVVGHINPPCSQGLGRGPEGAASLPVLTVDMRRLNRLRRFDSTSHLATFGAGITGPDLEAQLRARGFTLGHFPQSFEYSTLGGWIVTRSSGQQSLGYGRIERLFAGGKLEAPAGSLNLQPFPASAAGPDLREVVLGSEGRLGVLTEATMRVTPLPETEAFHAVFFADFESGKEAVRDILQARLPLSMVRLSTSAETEITLALAGHRRIIGSLERLLSLRGVGQGKAMLLLGFSGRAALVKLVRKEALGLVGAHGGVHVGRAFGKEWSRSRFRTPYLRNTLWELGYAVDTLETAADWTKVSQVIGAVESALRDGLAEIEERVHVFTHLSQLYPYGASIYTTYVYRISPDSEETLRRWQTLKAAASAAIVGHKCTITHQHGVGTDHLAYMTVEKGAVGIAALDDLCRSFDPLGIMNPGKLIPTREGQW